MSRPKEKTEYYDDGRTVADMSGVGHSPWYRKGSNPGGVSFREAWKTYWSAVKLMLGPMLVVTGVIGVIYLVILVLFRLSY